MKNVIIIFLDGVGIGREDYVFNPFFKYGFKTFTEIFNEIPSYNYQYLSTDNYILFPVDPVMGIDGLPQSGTGQTSIFCGVNAPELIGQHFGPYPYSTLIPYIQKKNILKYFLDKNQKVSFLNAYPKVFFDYLKSGKTRLSVTTLMCKFNNMRLNKARDVWKGQALTSEITNARWQLKLNYKLPVISPELAAKRLLKVASKNKITLFEYFLTDHLGHGRYDGAIIQMISDLDQFLLTILKKFDRKTTTILICSDHGNFEDLSTKSHTLNPSLCITAGLGAKYLSSKIKSLADIKGAIIKLLK